MFRARDAFDGHGRLERQPVVILSTGVPDLDLPGRETGVGQKSVLVVGAVGGSPVRQLSDDASGSLHRTSRRSILLSSEGTRMRRTYRTRGRRAA